MKKETPKREAPKKKDVPAKPKKDCLVFKNYHADFLLMLLIGRRGQPVMLHGADLRARNAFVKIIKQRSTEIEEARLDLIKQYAEKDKKGEPKIEKNEAGEEVFKMKDMAAFQKELAEYRNEDFVIDLLPSNSETISAVKKLVLNSRMELTYDEGLVYDEICSAFEA